MGQLQVQLSFNLLVKSHITFSHIQTIFHTSFSNFLHILFNVLHFAPPSVCFSCRATSSSSIQIQGFLLSTGISFRKRSLFAKPVALPQ